MDHTLRQLATCRCGKATVHITGRPLLRVVCHCLTCQAFNGAAFADVTVLYARDARLGDEHSVNFRVYQQPPLVQRGQCAHCGGPAVEKIRVPLFPTLTVVPSGNVENQAWLPQPALHMFYHRRQADAQDSLPKHSGPLKSQAHFMRALLRGMFSRP